MQGRNRSLLKEGQTITTREGRTVTPEEVRSSSVVLLQYCSHLFFIWEVFNSTAHQADSAAFCWAMGQLMPVKRMGGVDFCDSPSMICRPSERMLTVQVIGPTKLGRSLAVLGGPAATPNAARQIEGVDLLVHPAYLGSVDSNSAHASTAGTAASQAGAKHLCITGMSQSCWQDTLSKLRCINLKRPYTWSCRQHIELDNWLPSACLARKVL